jgi:hypothetical protein
MKTKAKSIETKTKPLFTYIRSIDIETGKETDEDCWKNTGVWSIFENGDKKLKKEIKNFPTPDSFEGWPGEMWKVEEYDGEEVKCVSGRNVKYFPKTEVEENLREAKKKLIIEKYDPLSTLFAQFGELYFADGHRERSWNTHNITTLLGGYLPGHEGGLASMSYAHEQERQLSVNDRKIELSYRNAGTSCFIEFTEDGDFIARDYNVAFKNFSQEKPSYNELISLLEKAVKKLGSLEYSEKSNVFYGESFCYVPSFYREGDEQEPYKLTFELEFVPRREGKDDYQVWSGHPIYKKPKTAETIKPAKVWEILQEKFLQEISRKFID